MAQKSFLDSTVTRAFGALVTTGREHDTSIRAAAFALTLSALDKAGREMKAGEYDADKSRAFALSVHDMRVNLVLGGFAYFQDTQDTLDSLMSGRDTADSRIKGVQMYFAGCKGLKPVAKFGAAQTLARKLFDDVRTNDADKAKEFAGMGDNSVGGDFNDYMTGRYGATLREVNETLASDKPKAPAKTLIEKIKGAMGASLNPADFDSAIRWLTERRAEVAKIQAEAAEAAEAATRAAMAAKAEADAEAEAVKAIAASAKAEGERKAKAA